MEVTSGSPRNGTAAAAAAAAAVRPASAQKSPSGLQPSPSQGAASAAARASPAVGALQAASSFAELKSNISKHMVFNGVEAELDKGDQTPRRPETGTDRPACTCIYDSAM